MGKNLNEINPELKPGDRIIIIYMDGESSETGLEFGSTKGKVIEKINQPKCTLTQKNWREFPEMIP